jgi:hypothetical protein
MHLNFKTKKKNWQEINPWVRRGGGLKISHISGKLILIDIKEINYINLESFFLPPMTRAWIGKLKRLFK